MRPFNRIYYIKKWEALSRIMGYPTTSYFKKPCRELCRGRNGNILIEFEDGYKMITIRRGVRCG